VCVCVCVCVFACLQRTRKGKQANTHTRIRKLTKKTRQRILDWLLWIIDILDLLAQPHNSRSYVQIGMIMVLLKCVKPSAPIFWTMRCSVKHGNTLKRVTPAVPCEHREERQLLRHICLACSFNNLNIGCMHPVACVRSSDGGFYPSTQRHYRRLILLLILVYYIAKCFGRTTIIKHNIH
jgi:hypothetical protein